MRVVALLLLLALSGPTLLAAVCDVRCLGHLHQHAKAVSASCHEHMSHEDGPALSSGTTVCHGESENAGTIANVTQPASNLALLDVEATVPAATSLPEVRLRATRINPPDRLPITTPLRI